MIETRQVETSPGMVFDVSVAGDPAAPLVLMLHGYNVSRHLWDAQVPAIAAAGYFAVAPNQRGYSAGARPDPADHDQYRLDLLVQDAFDIVAALGHGERRFHLVGHDWGGSLSWVMAWRRPERLASLTMFSRPHPGAFAQAMRDDPEQPHRSRHHKAFLEPDAGPKLLADDAAILRTRLEKSGVPAEMIARHMAVLASPPAIEAALAWYRARGERDPLGPIAVPTLFAWGDADDTVGRMAAEGTKDFIAAPYRFEVLPGGSHYTPNQFPELVTELVLEWVGEYGSKG